MKKFIAVLTSTFLALVLLSCAQPQETAPAEPVITEADIEAVKNAVIETWNHLNEANAEGITAGLTDDVICFAGGDPQLVGKDAVVKHFENLFEASEIDLTVEFDDVKIIGDCAIYWGVWPNSSTSKETGETVNYLHNNFGVCQKQADGSWKTWRAMWAGRRVQTGN